MNDFYNVLNLDYQSGSIKATLQWNVSHDIFAGHFPGQPVVPGVCMLQIIKEMMVLCLEQKVNILESSQMKFLQFIDPRADPLIDIHINYSQSDTGNYKVVATLQKELTVFFRFIGAYGSLKANESEI